MKYLVWDLPNPEGVESSYPRVKTRGNRQVTSSPALLLKEKGVSPFEKLT